MSSDHQAWRNFTHWGIFPDPKERDFFYKLLLAMKLSIANSKRNAQNAITYPPHIQYSPIIHLFFIIGITKLQFMGGKCQALIYVYIYLCGFCSLVTRLNNYDRASLRDLQMFNLLPDPLKKILLILSLKN